MSSNNHLNHGHLVALRPAIMKLAHSAADHLQTAGGYNLAESDFLYIMELAELGKTIAAYLRSKAAAEELDEKQKEEDAGADMNSVPLAAEK